MSKRYTLVLATLNPTHSLTHSLVSAVGEPPLCMAASALFAIKHAIEAARKDAAKDTVFPLSKVHNMFIYM